MHPSITPYIAVAELIVATFGHDVEVVLHDFADPQHSVVYVANNTVTGRQIGQSFEHLFTEASKTPPSEHGFLANYYFECRGKTIRSSSLFIRDAQHRLIGALCVNIDTTATVEQIKRLEATLPGLTRMPDPAAMPTRPMSLTDQTEELIDSLIGPSSETKLTRTKRHELIRFLRDRGVFQMKGAVGLVARKLHVAKVTVYSDLDQLKQPR